MRLRARWWRLRKRFFFEKKNQKTFATSLCRRAATVGTARAAPKKSFLVLFFKKERLSCAMLNLITDIDGVQVGQADDAALRSGVTCIRFIRPAIAAVSMLGGAPAARETALLELEMTVERIDAVVLSGGSTYGLDATSGVQSALREDFQGAPPPGYIGVPIVVQASLFDLANGGEKNWGRISPYAELGYRAARAARPGRFALGSHGAGLGATTATVRGGLGSASATTAHGHGCASLVAVNAIGAPTLGDTRFFWAAPYERNGEFGGLGLPPITPDHLRLRTKTPPAPYGTTIGLVATDASLTPAQAKRLAICAQDGLARAIYPAHLARDGDTMFAAATGAKPLARDEFDELCLAAMLVTARAIGRGVYEAESRDHGQPCWHDRFEEGAAF
jgi:L-aminopeptidase/D-esterase-like protein